ncbi:hypothetical protein BpHYR1_031617 [Brachionus plicatilis]|uniref:Uncharacterized protein n=1 Tax=Brachionus plicatilis TaxID=10195 RepID=A0A3M7SIG1_BRAPC|nr:hypothetical protein BpHYR1_031617 [Brachionus plicatilis]
MNYEIIAILASISYTSQLINCYFYRCYQVATGRITRIIGCVRFLYIALTSVSHLYIYNSILILEVLRGVHVFIYLEI